MQRPHPFRFGIAGQGHTAREWRFLAHEAEELGYATFLWADHPNYDFATAVALQAAADATTTLRIGSLVFNNDFRHPTMLAKDVATLDVLSNGRFEFGIGAGWNRSEYEQVGIAFDPPGIRLHRLEEAIHLIKAILGEQMVTFAGKYYNIYRLNGRPKPIQRPHPPLYIGGGEKRLLSIAAREADIVGIHFMFEEDGAVDLAEYTSAALQQKVAWVYEAARERFGHLELSLLMRYVAITAHRQEAIEQFIRRNAWHGLSHQRVLDNPYALIGDVDQVTEKLQMLREKYHISYIIIPATYLHLFAPIVYRLAGK